MFRIASLGRFALPHRRFRLLAGKLGEAPIGSESSAANAVDRTNGKGNRRTPRITSAAAQRLASDRSRATRIFSEAARGIDSLEVWNCFLDGRRSKHVHAAADSAHMGKSYLQLYPSSGGSGLRMRPSMIL